MLRTTYLRAFCGLLVLGAVPACKHDARVGDAPAASNSSAPTTASGTDTAPQGSVRGTFPVPSGPKLAVVAGQGVGPIRLGATVPTIERLMDAPCEDKTDKLCRYISRAVEFELGPDGKVTRIHAHRMGRPAGNGRVYGIFNGAIPPDLRFDMIVPAVQQYLGPPEKVEQGNQGATPETTEQHVYKGMVLEYDRLDNRRLVLGGIRIPN